MKVEKKKSCILVSTGPRQWVFLNFCVRYNVITDCAFLKNEVFFLNLLNETRWLLTAPFFKGVPFHTFLSHNMNDIDTEDCCLHYGFAVKEYD